MEKQKALIDNALGFLSSQSEKQFYNDMKKLFEPLSEPEPGDWLHSHKEVPQPYINYKEPNINYLNPNKKTIYLLPFGHFDKVFMGKIVLFCSAFYPTALVKILPEKDILKQIPQIRKRQNFYGDQYICEDILTYMKTCVPKDAYCVMGVTMKDIYPGPNWNFVYGWATYKARVGIFSFVRWTEKNDVEKGTVDWNDILYPSVRTVVHEVGHMFGVTHCIYNRCLMNGFNNIQQNYRNPFQFCPVCFRKLQSNLKCDLDQRYTKLIETCQRLEDPRFKKDIELYSMMLKILPKEEKGKREYFSKPKIQAKIPSKPNYSLNKKPFVKPVVKPATKPVGLSSSKPKIR